jgi:transposase-like protein
MSKKHIRCTSCSSLSTQSWGSYTSSTGTIQRFRCLECRKSFTFKILKYAQVTPSVQVRLTREHLEKRASIRTLARLEGYSKQTVQNAIHTVTAQVASAAWIANRFSPDWGGYLAIDGTTVRVWDWAARHFRYSKAQRRWLHKMTLLVCLDLKTLDVPMHHLGSEETTIDLVLMLRELKAVHYTLLGVVTDGNMDIKKAVDLVFEGVTPHQLCQLHYLKNLRKRVKDGTLLESQYREAKKKIPKGERPSFPVPDELFTYLEHPGMPRTNQSLENLNRFFKLRLKTMGTFHSWQTATWYCDALVAHRRFLKFTDRKRQPNGKSPLELAGCDIEDIDYLTREQKTNKQLGR